MPKARRVPIKDIENKIKALFHNSDDPSVKDELLTGKPSVFVVFENLVKGNLSKAVKSSKDIQNRLGLIRSIGPIKKKTGLTKMTDHNIQVILTSLVKGGVKYEKLTDYFVNGIQKMRDMDSENFDSLVTNMTPEDLVLFIGGSMPHINDKSKRTQEGIKLTIFVEGKLGKLKNDSIRKIAIIERRIKTKKKNLQEYRKKHPKVVLDKEIAEQERDLAQFDYMLSVQNHNLLMAKTKHVLANTYLSKKTINPTYVKEIVNAKDYGALGTAASFCGLPRPSTLNQIQALSLQSSLLHTEYLGKKMIGDNKVINVYVPVNRYRKEKYEFFPLDAHAEFMNKGNLSETQIPLIGDIYNGQSKLLIDTLNGHVLNENRANIEFNKFSKNNTRTIKDIPKAKQYNAANSSNGYLTLLSTMRGTCFQIISKLESLVILQKKSNNPANPIHHEIHGLKQKIQEFKERAKEYKAKAANVAKFLGAKVETGTDDIDSLTASPLHGPLLRKRLSPYMKRIENKEIAMNKAFKLLGGVQPYLNAKIKQGQPSLIDKAFKDGLRKFKAFAASKLAARTEAINVRDDLTKLMRDPHLAAHLPASVRSGFVVMLASKIKTINRALKSSKSPISLVAIKGAKAAISKFRKDRNGYYKKKFWTGVAIAGCIVLAAGAAFAGGAAFGALGGKLFGTMAAGGAFVPGAITVSAGAAKVLVGGMIVVGSSAGGVIGSRIAMTGFDVTGVADFGGLKGIWNPKKMGKEFLVSCVIGGGALGLAKGFSTGASLMSKSSYFKTRFPKLHGAATKHGLNRFLRNPDMFPGYLSSLKTKGLPSNRLSNVPRNARITKPRFAPAPANISAVNPPKLSAGRLKPTPQKAKVTKPAGAKPATTGKKPPLIGEKQLMNSIIHDKTRAYWHKIFRTKVRNHRNSNPNATRKEAENAVLKDPSNRFLRVKVRELNLRNWKPNTTKTPDLRTPHIKPHGPQPSASGKGARSNTGSPEAGGNTGSLRLTKPGIDGTKNLHVGRSTSAPKSSAPAAASKGQRSQAEPLPSTTVQPSSTVQPAPTTTGTNAGKTVNTRPPKPTPKAPSSKTPTPKPESKVTSQPGGTKRLHVGRNKPKPKPEKAPRTQKPAPTTTPKTQPVLKTTTAKQRERMYWSNKFKRTVRRHMDKNKLENTAANRKKAEDAVLAKDSALKAKIESLKLRGKHPGGHDLLSRKTAPTNPQPAASRAPARSNAGPQPSPSSQPAPSSNTGANAGKTVQARPPKKPATGSETPPKPKIEAGRVGKKQKITAVSKKEFKKDASGKVAGQTVTPPDPVVDNPNPKVNKGRVAPKAKIPLVDKQKFRVVAGKKAAGLTATQPDPVNPDAPNAPKPPKPSGTRNIKKPRPRA